MEDKPNIGVELDFPQAYDEFDNQVQKHRSM